MQKSNIKNQNSKWGILNPKYEARNKSKNQNDNGKGKCG